MLEDGIGYMKIRLFSSTTDQMLGELLESAREREEHRPGRAAPEGAGLVLDLRRNPGGLLDQGMRVADRFIAEGLLVKTVGKGGQRDGRGASAHAAAPGWASR